MSRVGRGDLLSSNQEAMLNVAVVFDASVGCLRLLLGRIILCRASLPCNDHFVKLAKIRNEPKVQDLLPEITIRKQTVFRWYFI
jgi:hypothetical protein